MYFALGFWGPITWGLGTANQITTRQALTAQHCIIRKEAPCPELRSGFKAGRLTIEEGGLEGTSLQQIGGKMESPERSVLVSVRWTSPITDPGPPPTNASRSRRPIPSITIDLSSLGFARTMTVRHQDRLLLTRPAAGSNMFFIKTSPMIVFAYANHWRIGRAQNRWPRKRPPGGRTHFDQRGCGLPTMRSSLWFFAG